MVPFSRTRDVLAEAIMDREVMRDLLRRVPNQAASDHLSRRMNAWLVNLVPEPGEEDERAGPMQIDITQDASSF